MAKDVVYMEMMVVIKYDGHQPLQELVCRVKSLRQLTHVEVKTLRMSPAARRELLFPDIID